MILFYFEKFRYLLYLRKYYSSKNLKNKRNIKLNIRKFKSTILTLATTFPKILQMLQRIFYEIVIKLKYSFM